MRPLAAVLVGLTAALLAVGAWRTGALDRGERALVDARFSVRGDRPQPKGVAVVAIDDRSLIEDLGAFPIPRGLYGRTIDALHEAGARAIVLDVQFDSPSRAAQDDALLAAAGRARDVVFGTTLIQSDGSPFVFVDETDLKSLGARAGDARFPLQQGVFRETAVTQDGAPTLAGAALAAAHARAPRGGPFPIDYVGGPGAVLTVSIKDVLNGTADLTALRGRIVVIGATAPSLQDQHTTPVGELSGPDVQAQAIQTLLDGAPLRDWPLVPGLLVLLALAGAPPLAARLTRGIRALVLAGLVALAGAALWAGAAQLLFDRGHIVPLAPGWLAAALGGIGAIVVGATGEVAQRRRTRTLFERFVPAAVVDDVLARSGDDLRLGGVRRDGTVLFCDLRGFTGLAEDLPAERVIDVLNRYLEEASDAILDQGGTLVSYLGDGIMAVFGAPLEQADHADRGVAAAREIAGPRLAAFNAWLLAEGLSAEPLGIGVGVNSGPVMSGNVGSARRVEYTAVGDTTNVAARLQALTREHGLGVLITDATRSALSEAAAALCPLRAIGDLTVRGRSGTVLCWALD